MAGDKLVGLDAALVVSSLAWMDPCAPCGSLGLKTKEPVRILFSGFIGRTRLANENLRAKAGRSSHAFSLAPLFGTLLSPELVETNKFP